MTPNNTSKLFHEPHVAAAAAGAGGDDDCENTLKGVEHETVKHERDKT